jgi:hypothetical protein
MSLLVAKDGFEGRDGHGSESDLLARLAAASGVSKSLRRE